MQATFHVFLWTIITWVKLLLSNPVKSFINQWLTLLQTTLALLVSTKLLFLKLTNSFMLILAGMASLRCWELRKTISLLITAPPPFALATSLPRLCQIPTGELETLLSNLTTLKFWKSKELVKNSPQVTLATANTGMALHGLLKRISTLTKSELSIDSASTRISPSTSLSSRTVTADFAYARRFTMLRTSEPASL